MEKKLLSLRVTDRIKEGVRKVIKEGKKEGKRGRQKIVKCNL